MIKSKSSPIYQVGADGLIFSCLEILSNFARLKCFDNLKMLESSNFLRLETDNRDDSMTF